MSMLNRLLGMLSGGTGETTSDHLLFDKVIGFKGVVPGVGTSTLLLNLAVALAETPPAGQKRLSVCVIDPTFVLPTQMSLLGGVQDKAVADLLEYSGDVSKLTVETAYRGVRLLSLHNRTILDMLSSRDNENFIMDSITKLKSYFDVILVDLSGEYSNINIHAAIKCNRIVMVADPSIKCMANLRKSLNTQATLGVPLGKADHVILNKVVPDIIVNTKGALADAGLTLLGEVPLSVEIAKAGISGNYSYKTSSHKDIVALSATIDAMITNLFPLTPVNQEVLSTLPVYQDKGVPTEADQEIVFYEDVSMFGDEEEKEFFVNQYSNKEVD